ncbi:MULTISPECIES: 2,3,4,5-tetrahydropyridine-2,6-dicarboxylate N-acetyltransferase [Clostridium]|uniref:2,3,4,5-tetrahydropyridine-2,6-dicarboxylate N-acetyltransferase n=1 Tax=Clostridium TaxID=1485 RepID=UPI00082662E9|nr:MULTISPECIES: 2,3,4,5-tetrahydropyridine-2,6-dicarboxylate N-acetyltransferase [Clostridium]PJI09667.1 2,3,4,5-tetrahydropyridine-2,6-dicarboxylate N-acetyltransferase [Clostridium sp. CT7]
MNYDLTNPYEIAKYIKEAKKTTPLKVYVNGNLDDCHSDSIDLFGTNDFYVLFGESDKVSDFLQSNHDKIKNFRIEQDRRNSAIPLIDMTKIDARIEPGAIIRDKVSIGKNAVIMMGAVINIGSEIGEGAMIDMNAVVGARGKIGKRTHVGAGAVIAGVLEPPSKSPCEIGDDVLIGANSVILEGVKIGSNSVIAAGSVVVEDIPSGVVAAGTPAKIVKKVDDKTKDKTKIMADLRK